MLKKENIQEVYDSKYVKVFDLQYEPGKHYLDATRREKEDLVATKTDAEFKAMLPDAVSCAVILRIKGQAPLLYLSREYRYPTGQFLLSVPAGLLDAADIANENPIFSATKREILEETGITLKDEDTIQIVNPLIFSTPGMTDECNAFVQVVLNREEMPSMNQDLAEGTECFDGYRLATKEEAIEILKSGTDENGIFYSVYTWMALMCFVSDIWTV